MSEIALTGAGWALAGTAGALLAGFRLALQRRRRRLNQAFHELRRPLQALTLASHRPPVDRDLAVRQVELACAALADAEHALNGGAPPLRRSLVSARRLLEEACGRWRRSARDAGRTLTLRWSGPDAGVLGDPVAIAAAVDNLVANAIEHGGEEIALSGAVRGWKVRLAVSDLRRGGLPERRGPARRGHGLRIVARTVAGHGGRFTIDARAGGFDAVIELPVMRLDEAHEPHAAARA